MAMNPVLVNVPADTITLVASSISEGNISIPPGPRGIPARHTYRMAGDPAPADISDFVEFESLFEPIIASAPIDVYVHSSTDLTVRVARSS